MGDDYWIDGANLAVLSSFPVYFQTQLIKAREQQHQQPPQQQQQQQQIQMQQMLLHRAAQQQQQQQRRDGSLLNGTASGFSGNDPLIRQNPANANSMAAKMYEERLKLPPQRDSLDEASIKVPHLARSASSYLLVYSYHIVSWKHQLQQRYGENVGQVIDPNQALLKAAAAGQSSGYVQNSKLRVHCIFHCYKLHHMADMNT
jgi:hypothetical protein